ncbi:MAG TPA: hypothetical protein VNZ86_13540, partial [Bacteroidia bacterium]|nr:hypothetical protein [Bacteroidia bacterium]
WIHGSASAANDQFIVSNPGNNQRTITTIDSSRVQLENIEFRTQEGNLSNAASYYMNYNAQGKSVLYVNKVWLNTSTAWLLCNLFHKSTLLAFQPNHMPTEIYVQDTAQVAIHGSNASTGLWLNMQGVNGTMNLPPSQSTPYTWSIGRGTGGLNTTWYTEVDTANPGLGIQVYPNTNVTVNGSGGPSTGELKVAMIYSNNTDTAADLAVGLQNTTVRNGPAGWIKLNQVNLGPIAWQLYAMIHENLWVKKSVVNEIGIAGPSTVKIDSSLLQLAVLASVGAGGSSMTINNSEIWNQRITAANQSTLVLNHCTVTGSIFSTGDTTSRITVNGGCFNQNPTGCTPNTMVNISTGQPYCNPFIPPGYPQN